jgi:outer membrane protein TolC
LIDQNKNNYKKYLFCISLFFTLQLSVYTQTQVIESISSATLPLSVKDSILMALENNNALEVERYSPAISQTFVEQQLAVFDPLISANVNGGENNGKRTSGVGEFRDVSTRTKGMTAGVSKRFQYGVELGLSSEINTRESNVFTRLYSSRLGATLNVPVLEGRGNAVNLVGVHQAEKDIEISQHALHGFVLALINQVETLYWDLYSAQEELSILQDSRFLAEQQLMETRERIAVGALAEIELAAAEGELALRDGAVIDAESDLKRNRLELLATINPPMDHYWELNVDLVEIPALQKDLTFDLREYIPIALTLRPEILESISLLEREELQLIRTKNGLLPRLDFFLNYGKTGYSNSFEGAFTTLEDDTFDINIGFEFQHSFGRRAQHAAQERATLNVDEAQSAIQNLEQLVELDVRTAHVEIERYHRQIESTRIATRFQEAKYQAELEKFRVGKSTNLLVLVTQRDLTQSRLDELRAVINLRKAVAQFYYATGTLSDYHQIVLPAIGLN